MPSEPPTLIRHSPSSEPPTDRMKKPPPGVLAARAEAAARLDAAATWQTPVTAPRPDDGKPGKPTPSGPLNAPPREGIDAGPATPERATADILAPKDFEASEESFPRPPPTPLPPRRLSGADYEAVHAKTEIIQRPRPRRGPWILLGAVGVAALLGTLFGVVVVEEESGSEARPEHATGDRTDAVQESARSLSGGFRPPRVRPPAMPPEVRALDVNSRRLAASQRRIEAGELHAAGEHGEARTAWVQALTYLPADDRASEGLAETLGALGEGRLALGWAARAVELAPSDSHHREVYGRLLERAGEVDLALAEYEAGLQVAPQNLRLRQRVSALRRINER